MKLTPCICPADDILSFVVVVDGTLLVTPGSFLYGNDVIPRNETVTTGFMRTWIDPNRLLASGVLTRYYIYANPASQYGPIVQYSPSVTRIQIWRPEQSSSRPQFTLVWERRVRLNTTTHGMLYTVTTTHTVVP